MEPEPESKKCAGTQTVPSPTLYENQALPCMGDVHHCSGPEMTYIVSSGTVKPYYTISYPVEN